MTFSTKTLSIVTVVLVLAVAGGGIYWRVRPEPENSDDTASSETETSEVVSTSASEQFAIAPTPVSGTAAILDTLWVEVTAAGQAEAFREAVLTAQVEGQVLDVWVQENSSVASGRALIQIDTTEYALELATAQSELERA